jgi:hypothetical protein
MTVDFLCGLGDYPELPLLLRTALLEADLDPLIDEIGGGVPPDLIAEICQFAVVGGLLDIDRRAVPVLEASIRATHASINKKY